MENYKKLRASKIAWGGAAVVILGALQLMMASTDLSQFETIETAVPAALTLITGLVVIIWRQRTQFLIE